MSDLIRRTNVDHSTLFGGVGALVKVSPVRLVGGVQLGGTTRLMGRKSYGFARVTCGAKFGSSRCFDGYFGRVCKIAPARCGHGGLS